jgi:hypothetical protein
MQHVYSSDRTWGGFRINLTSCYILWCSSWKNGPSSTTEIYTDKCYDTKLLMPKLFLEIIKNKRINWLFSMSTPLKIQIQLSTGDTFLNLFTQTSICKLLHLLCRGWYWFLLLFCHSHTLYVVLGVQGNRIQRPFHSFIMSLVLSEIPKEPKGLCQCLWKVSPRSSVCWLITEEDIVGWSLEDIFSSSQSQDREAPPSRTSQSNPEIDPRPIHIHKW